MQRSTERAEQRAEKFKIGEIEQLLDAYRERLEANDFDGLAALYAPDAIVDVTVPAWRFQLRGPRAIAEQFAEWYAVPARILRWDVLPAAWGAVLEAEEVHDDGIYFRYTYHLVIHDGAIVRHHVFCPGAWTPQDLERQRAEAPMLDREEEVEVT